VTRSLSPAPRLVADINVILSGICGRPSGASAQLYERFRRGEVRYLLSRALLDELQRVFSYPEVVALGVTPELAFGVAVDLLQLGEYIAPVPRYDWPSVPDRKD
jgi:predicted nucleic acid-binding protein